MKTICRYCRTRLVTRQLLWAGGRAFVGVCAALKCGKRATEAINKNPHPEIVGWKPVRVRHSKVEK